MNKPTFIDKNTPPEQMKEEHDAFKAKIGLYEGLESKVICDANEKLSRAKFEVLIAEGALKKAQAAVTSAEVDLKWAIKRHLSEKNAEAAVWSVSPNYKPQVE